MTESTKNQFDAPWYVFSSPDDEITVIENESGRVLAELYDVKTANRLSHLPELYDALMQAAFYKCYECMGGLRHNIDLTQEDLIENGCPKNGRYREARVVSCVAMNWLKLLKKVRDGE